MFKVDPLECLNTIIEIVDKNGGTLSDFSIENEKQTICFDMLRRSCRTCFVKDPRRSSRQHPVYIVNKDCLATCVKNKLQIQKPEETVSLQELIDLAWRRFLESPFAELNELNSALVHVTNIMKIWTTEVQHKPHVILIGPPGSGKSFILSLFDHDAAPIFYGATTTPMGLVTYLAERPVALIRFDELDKAKKETIDAMLHIMSEGRLVMLSKQRGRIEIKVNAPLLAAANRDFAIKRSESWKALRDRFLPVELGDLSKETLFKVLSRHITDKELVEKIVEARVSLRKIMYYIELWKHIDDHELVKEIILDDIKLHF